MTLPFVSALCPSFRRPELMSSSLALWLDMDYPLDRRQLVVLEDGGTYYNHKEPGYTVWSAAERYPHLSAKYNEMLFDLMPRQTDVVLIWEDDDTYGPQFINTHLKALENAELSKGSRVYGDYGTEGKYLVEETNVRGRFHSGMAVRVDLLKRIGGWPDTKRADFDQQLISRLEHSAKGIGDPCQFGPVQFVYRWNTNHAHFSALGSSGGDESCYEKYEQLHQDVPFVGRLVPKYDDRTLNVLKQMAERAKQAA